VKMFDGFLFALYLIGYGLLRFLVEYFRQPDPQLGFVLGYLTIGQLLCVIMLLAGIFIMLFRYNMVKAKKTRPKVKELFR